MTLSSCCCCIELRVGCLIIGYLNLIGEIFGILTGMLVGVLASQGEDNDWQVSVTTLLIITVIIMVLFIPSLAFTIMLLVGVHQHKRGLVKAFLIYSVICLVLEIIMFVASLVLLSSFHIEAEKVIPIILFFFLSFYFLLVIKSYHEKMDDPAKKPADNLDV